MKNHNADEREQNLRNFAKSKCGDHGASEIIVKNQLNQQQIKKSSAPKISSNVHCYSNSNSNNFSTICKNRLTASPSQQNSSSSSSSVVVSKVSATGLIAEEKCREKVKIANVSSYGDSIEKREKAAGGRERETNCGGDNLSCLRDKIRRFERQPPNNNNHHLHENNIINRTTTITRTTEGAEVSTKKNHATAQPVRENDPDVVSVSENICCNDHQSNRKYDDDKNSQSQCCTLLINRHSDDSRSIDVNKSEKCSGAIVSSDGNNNRIVKFSDLSSVKSFIPLNSQISCTTRLRQLSSDFKDINLSTTTRELAEVEANGGGDIGVNKFVIRQPISPDIPKCANLLHDNDFSFIDSSSRSVSRSSSASVVSDGSDSVKQQRKYRIPKITRNNNNNSYNSSEVEEEKFSVKTCANQNIYSLDGSKNDFKYTNDVVVVDDLNDNLEITKHGSQILKLSANNSPSTIINQSISEDLVSF